MVSHLEQITRINLILPSNANLYPPLNDISRLPNNTAISSLKFNRARATSGREFVQWRANFGRFPRREENWIRGLGSFTPAAVRHVASRGFARGEECVSPLGNLSSRVASRGRCPVHTFQRSYRPCLTYPSSRFARLINSVPSEIRNSLLLR